jgi:manganese-dependent ADP-ribose/CDP-alcohol diphosphatase
MKKKLLSSLVLPALLASPQQPDGRSAPRFSFAVLTDIQYGDQETAGKREYRKSPAKLRQAVDALNARHNLAFAIQLGDLIDSRSADLSPILSIFNQLRMPRYHVLGNHDFAAPRDVLLRELGMPAAHYEFAYGGWRFLVLDGMEISASSQPGREMLQGLREKRAANAFDWNGAIGPEQIAWLRSALKQSSQKKERVILFCHFPLLRESSRPDHLLWNHEAVRQIVEGESSAAAWFNGHDHQGGYAGHEGIHFVTFPGMVESGERNSYTIVDVYADRLELEGAGTAPSRTLRIVPRR